MEELRGTSVGGLLILLAIAGAIISLFLPWVAASLVSYNGFSGYDFSVLLFYIYPLRALRRMPMNKRAGVVCGLGALAAAIWYMHSAVTELFGVQVNLAGRGVYVFALSSVVLASGAGVYEVAA